MDRNLITSVLGFNLKADIKDENGQIIPAGIKRSIMPKVYASRVNTRLFDRRFFTSFNEALLNKIRDCRNLND
jgi:hypothetical protein